MNDEIELNDTDCVSVGLSGEGRCIELAVEGSDQ